MLNGVPVETDIHLTPRRGQPISGPGQRSGKMGPGLGSGMTAQSMSF
jgi:hypothetical protein